MIEVTLLIALARKATTWGNIAVFSVKILWISIISLFWYFLSAWGNMFSSYTCLQTWMRKVIRFQEFGSLIVQFYDIDILHVCNNNSITWKQSLWCANIFFMVYLHWDIDVYVTWFLGNWSSKWLEIRKKLSDGSSIYEKLMANSSST